ncbi:tripartite motif-containing protein 44 [Gadus chalcogrammus]|uniref:tripartite motif-containing protein 44 n=1 Tax=Gadus chalcogrammus TaxID=1042646 RepID=UPI0024C4A38A|nr:tripartite motif-containing protein 44 [Gadus chalcogrammus]
MSTQGGPWDPRETGPTADNLPQPDGSCDVCEPDEAKPSTEVCAACSFAFCPTHAEEHSRRTNHRLTPFHQETPGSPRGFPAAAAAARTAQEVGDDGFVLNEEEEQKEEVGAAAASRPRDTSKQAEILGMLAAVVEMVVGGGRAPEVPEVVEEDGAGAVEPGDQPAEGIVPGGPSQAGEEGAQPAAQQEAPEGAQPGAQPGDQQEDAPLTVERLRCPVHAQEGTLYCRTDEKVVCVLCALRGEHRGHEIITLYEAYVWQKSRPGPDILAETKLMGERIMSKWSDPVLTTDELQAFVDAQFQELKRLIHVQEARNRHLVDLKEAFITAAAAEQIAEITLETDRLQEEMVSISQELGALNRAKMRADLAAAAAPGAVIPEGLRERLGQPDGRPHDVEARPRLPEPRREPRRDPAARRDRDDDGPRQSQGNAP